MSRVSPKPVITQTVRTWNVEPGMTFAVAEDNAGRLWIEQSCPVGTHFWTVDQAVALANGLRTGRTLREAIAFCRDRESLDHLPTMMPVFDAELESAIAREPSRSHRTSCTDDSRLARV